MRNRKNRLSVQYRQPFLKALGAIFLIVAISLTQVPVPEVQAITNDFRMDGNTLIKYTGNSENVTIPDTVERISTEAFADNEKLTFLTIPESVTKIENSAFLNCTALKSLKIPDSVKEIGKSAFSGCSALSTLSIGTGLTILGAGAFAGCTSLSTATIAKSDPSVSSANINDGNTSFTCKDGVIYGNKGTILCQMLAGRKSENYSMPSAVTNISEYAFWECENLKNIDLSNNLKEIPAYAFSNCEGLEKIDVPYSVKSIQMKAFENCSHLSQIEIPESVTFIHETAFDGCNLLDQNSISANTLDSKTVSENAAKEEKEQPASSEPIQTKPKIDGMETKEDGSVIGKTKIVGGQALVLINSKQANVISDGVSSNAILENKKEVISEDGKKVVKEAYYQAKELKKYKIPEGVKEIEKFAFSRTGLKQIDLPDTVTKIGYAAFYHCDELLDVTIPESVTQIEGEAFQKTAWMNHWYADTMAEDFLVVGDGILIAYKGNQETVTIPDSTKSIASEAFKNHTEIKEIILPKSLTTIYAEAFTGCKNLRSFSGGDSLTTVKDRAFENSPIEITSSHIETKSKYSMGTIGNYQILVKKKVKSPLFIGLKWAGILVFMVSGMVALTKAGIISRKK